MKTLSIVLSTLLGLAQPKLIIQSPDELRTKFTSNEGSIPAVYANFGQIPYGQSIVGHLFYNDKNQWGCDPDGEFMPTDWDEDKEDNGEQRHKMQPIIIVRRGQCHFVTKTRNIQRAGGALAIIVDNAVENIERIIMSDDGSGAGLTTPAMLIGKHDGEILFDFMKKQDSSNGVILNAQFVLKHQQDYAKVGIWYTSSNDKALDFLKNIGEYLKPIVKQMDFEPKFVTWSCENCKDTFKKKNCVSNGKYCAVQSDKEHPLDGREIILEDLREYCLYRKLQQKNRAEKFFDYIYHIHELCENRIDRKCYERGLQSIDFNPDWVDKCVEDSFERANDEPLADYDKHDNMYLRDMADDWKKYGSHIQPSLVINDVTFRGQLSPFNAFEAICAGFAPGHMPHRCKKWLHMEGIELIEDDDGVDAQTLLIIIGILIFVNAVLIFLYRRWVQQEIKEDMKIQVSSAVSQYVALSQVQELQDSNADILETTAMNRPNQANQNYSM